MTAMNQSAYSTTAIYLHWVIALLIITNLGLGISFDYVSRETRGELMGWHKPIGMVVLLLSVWRVGIRIGQGFPPLDDISRAEAVLARIIHVLVYGLMFLLPLSGYVMSSAAGRGISMFGLFDWPLLPIKDSPAGKTAAETHEVLSWILVLSLVLHVAGALKHHLFDRSAVLTRMLPFLKRPG
jgi:cytochrome b561